MHCPINKEIKCCFLRWTNPRSVPTALPHPRWKGGSFRPKVMFTQVLRVSWTESSRVWSVWIETHCFRPDCRAAETGALWLHCGTTALWCELSLSTDSYYWETWSVCMRLWISLTSVRWASCSYTSHPSTPSRTRCLWARLPVSGPCGVSHAV